MFQSIMKSYKYLEEGLSNYQYGVFSVGLAFLIDGCAKVLYVALGGVVTYPFVILFLLSGIVKLGGLLAYSLVPNVLHGRFNKLSWGLYNLIISDIGHALVFLFVLTTNLPDTLLIPSTTLLIVNIYLLKKEL